MPVDAGQIALGVLLLVISGSPIIAFIAYAYVKAWPRTRDIWRAKTADDFYAMAFKWADDRTDDPEQGLLLQALKRDPNHIASIALLLREYAHIGDFERARDFGERLVALRPDADSHFLLGQAELHLRHYAAAHDHLRQSYEAWKRAAQDQPGLLMPWGLKTALRRLAY